MYKNINDSIKIVGNECKYKWLNLMNRYLANIYNL